MLPPYFFQFQNAIISSKMIDNSLSMWNIFLIVNIGIVIECSFKVIISDVIFLEMIHKYLFQLLLSESIMKILFSKVDDFSMEISNINWWPFLHIWILVRKKSLVLENKILNFGSRVFIWRMLKLNCQKIFGNKIRTLLAQQKLPYLWAGILFKFLSLIKALADARKAFNLKSSILFKLFSCNGTPHCWANSTLKMWSILKWNVLRGIQ